MEASSSLTPSRVKTAPWPELKRGLSSNCVTAKVTVSSAEPDGDSARGEEEGEVRSWCVRERMERRESWYFLYFAGGRLEGNIFPAPPCMISRGEIPGAGLLYSILGFQIVSFEAKCANQKWGWSYLLQM